MNTNAWIEEEFGEVDFADARRDERLRRLLAHKWQNPQQSFSAAGHAEAMAASRFFENTNVTPEKILAAHRARTRERIQAGEHRRVLLVQDTTECDFTTHKKLLGTGPLSSPDRRGFFAHNHLVVTPERLPLGLWDTLIYARDDAEHGKSADCKTRPIEEKESVRWLEGYRHACALAGQAPACQVISAGDRENDIYEVFAEYWQRREQGLPVAELLIRSKVDRCLEPFEEAAVPAAPPLTPAPAEAAAPAPAQEKIRSRLAAAPVLGTVKFRVPQATQRNKKVKGSRQSPVQRSAREVEQEVRAIRIRLKPPRRPAAAGGPLPPVELTVVEAREINPPGGEEPLMWVLLTTLPVETFEQATEVLELYLCRWEIELFHKVLKSGCRLEEMQQRFDFTLLPAIVLYMLVAWRLLHVMRLGRACPELPCDVVFDESEWKSVVVVLKGRAALQPKPSVGEMVLMIAKLGGYLGRKNDPPPGMKSMWIGMTRLADFALCWERFQPAPSDTG
jgi:hypothetical protein